MAILPGIWNISRTCLWTHCGHATKLLINRDQHHTQCGSGNVLKLWDVLLWLLSQYERLAELIIMWMQRLVWVLLTRSFRRNKYDELEMFLRRVFWLTLALKQEQVQVIDADSLREIHFGQTRSKATAKKSQNVIWNLLLGGSAASLILIETSWYVYNSIVVVDVQLISILKRLILNPETLFVLYTAIYTEFLHEEGIRFLPHVKFLTHLG